MIKHIDFEPKVLKKGGLFKSEQVATFKELVDELNSWLGQNEATVINIETVLLPNIHDEDEEGSEDTRLGTGRETAQWYQVVRLWYK